MKLSLKYRLIASYVVISLVVVVSLLTTSKFIITRQFDDYITNNIEQRMVLMATQINLDLNRSSNTYEKMDWSHYGMTALDQGLLLSIQDNKDELIWCTECVYPSQAKEMLDTLTYQMLSYHRKFQFNLMDHTFDLIQKNQMVGTMVFTHYAPFYYNQSELSFLRMLDQVFWIAASFFFLVAVVLGYVMASRISKPLRHVIQQTKSIAQGKYHEQLVANSNMSEIDELVHAINGLTKTLDHQQVIRRKLAQNYAHEFRTPLAVLRSSIEGMIDGIWEVNEVRLQSLQEEILRLTRMIEDIDQLVEVEDQQLVLNYSSFDLLLLVETLAPNFEGDFTQKQIQFSLRGVPIQMNGDKDRIHQIMINLISNAIKYNHEGGFVVVSLVKRSDEVEIIVKDSGIGMAKEHLPFIFEHLYRIDESRGYHTRGNGIGLSIVKSIVLAHQGSIKVESEVGVGSTFHILLPLSRY